FKRPGGQRQPMSGVEQFFVASAGWLPDVQATGRG
ncbi:hypothetical protein PSYMO_38203, partial [Pseudomonas amygdali pv. mori str. 301020]